MSRYTGAQYRGASRDALARRREEAQERQAAYEQVCHELGDRPRLGRKMREATR